MVWWVELMQIVNIRKCAYMEGEFSLICSPSGYTDTYINMMMLFIYYYIE